MQPPEAARHLILLAVANTGKGGGGRIGYD